MQEHFSGGCSCSAWSRCSGKHPTVGQGPLRRQGCRDREYFNCCGVGLWIAVFAALEFAKCLLVALEGGLSNPVSRLGVVVLDALAGGVEMPKLELGFGVAMIGGLAIPRGGLRIAERDTPWPK